MPSIRTHIGEAPVRIEYSTFRGYGATMEEPGEPGGVELQSVEFNGRELINALTEAWVTVLEGRCMERHEDYNN